MSVPCECGSKDAYWQGDTEVSPGRFYGCGPCGEIYFSTLKEAKVMTEESNPKCDYGITFDGEAARGLDRYEVRKRWPRLFGPCPKGCGYEGIAYASYEHYLTGDW